MEILPDIRSPKDLRALPKEKLPAVAREMRQAILETVSRHGGHLGSSLGAAELTIALHYVFETPEDRLVWDTGHQGYGHKILTGRLDRMGTIRQYEGLSGFLRRSESSYDTFGAGHASTAVSAALGMAAARDRKKEKRKVVAVVSDGCMTGGMAFEGMQNAGQLGSDLLVVLNDNQMFISHRVGALGALFTKLLTWRRFRKYEKIAEKFLLKFPFWGAGLVRVAKRAKVLFFPGMIFEELGFSYFGPVDGHDLESLIEVLEEVKPLKGPVLLHVVTQKGKGYPPAETQPIAYHGLGKFDLTTGKALSSLQPAPPAYTKVFSQTMLKLAESHPNLVAITAAMPEGTGLDAFRDRFPGRYYDVGLAEQHAVTFAAGLACEGLRPVVAVYSTFLQRGFDQILHDVCLQNLPVIFALDRAGLVGEDGPTHHGAFDLSYLRLMPNMTVMAPADENELSAMLKTALKLSGPVAIRYPRGSAVGTPIEADPAALEIGRGAVLREGQDVVLAAIGNRVHPCLKAAQILERAGVSCGVLNLRFVKPIDRELLLKASSLTPRIVTVEDNAVIGGLGDAVLECVHPQAKVLKLGIPDEFIEHGTPSLLYQSIGLSEEKIAEQVLNWLRGDCGRTAARISNGTGKTAANGQRETAPPRGDTREMLCP